jgi:hypothetical protein
MRHVPALETCVFVALAGVLLAGFLFLVPERVQAGADTSGDVGCACPEAGSKTIKPKFAGLENRLDESDEIAALESVQVGLSHMDDGNPFIWRRPDGHLSGIVRPTVSFRNAEGAICRHVVVLLTTGYRTSTAEDIACRLSNRRWVLEG